MNFSLGVVSNAVIQLLEYSNDYNLIPEENRTKSLFVMERVVESRPPSVAPGDDEFSSVNKPKLSNHVNGYPIHFPALFRPRKFPTIVIGERNADRNTGEGTTAGRVALFVRMVTRNVLRLSRR